MQPHKPSPSKSRKIALVSGVSGLAIVVIAVASFQNFEVVSDGRRNPTPIAEYVQGSDEAQFSAPEGANTSNSAQSLTIAGQVINNEGIALRGVTVTLKVLSSGEIRTTTTSSFGRYSFDNLPSYTSVSVTASSKRYLFAPIPLFLVEDESDLTLTGVTDTCVTTRTPATADYGYLSFADCRLENMDLENNLPGFDLFANWTCLRYGFDSGEVDRKSLEAYFDRGGRGCTLRLEEVCRICRQ